MITRRILASLLVCLPLAACGDDGGGGTPDAGPTVDAAGDLCSELDTPAGTITSYPGTFSGSITGAGADLTVAQGVCDVEGDPAAPSWYEPVGEDAVVALTGLTAGTRYGVTLTSGGDLGFYVVTGCDVAAGGPAAGDCAVFDDRGPLGERSPFTASSAEAYVVVDTANLGGGPPTNGDFDLRVVQAECVDRTECLAPTPACVDFACVECANNFDCTEAATPVCDAATSTCVVGPEQCTGDDGNDAAPGDDGPAGATSIPTPTTDTPTVVTAAVCSLPFGEADYYELVVGTADRFGFELTFLGTDDLDVAIYDSAGVRVAAGLAIGPESFAASLSAGTYYLAVTMYSPMDTAQATAYTLTWRVAECEDSYDCLLPAEPVCSSSGLCDVGPAVCTGDDAGDTTGGGDDGPAGARSLTGAVATPVSLTGAVCSSPATEVDFYSVTVEQGEGLTIDLDWASTADLDLYAVDDQGVMHGLTFWTHPENVTLSYLPAGTYYIQVTLFGQNPVIAADPYTITATRTAAQVCATSADCDDEYSTQLYRGVCAAGACDFIPAGAGAPGQACDSNDDCTSTLCSYVPFDADASESVCTSECTTTADCVSIGAGLNCSAGMFMMCVPACASDLECGARTSSSALDTGEPWDYYACDTGTGVCTF